MVSRLRSIEGSAVFVTGAGSGLGEAVACAFAAEGAVVACADIRREAAARVSEEIESGGGHAIAVHCDVASEDSVREALSLVRDHFGRLDVAVNNAAIDHTVSVEDMTVGQWDQVISVNLKGPFLVSKLCFGPMKQQGGGHIINIASTAATRAWANAAAYHASKWGLVGFGRGLSVEGRPHHIRVTTIIPGGMRTHFFDRFEEQGIPLPLEDDLQDPANVAQVIVWAAQMPAESALQEAIVTPLTETSWP